MITNVPQKGEGSYDSKAILKSYKDQYGIEQNFGFLKDPVIVNSILSFVKRPVRTRMLGVVGRGREKLPLTRLAIKLAPFGRTFHNLLI